MTLPNDPPLQQLKFYASGAYPCGYLPGRQAKSLSPAPPHLVDAALYDELIRFGFRRSGRFVYRPYCDNCQACIPVRLAVEGFHPGRSQRRAWRQHSGLSTRLLPLQFVQEHFELYRAYQQIRHPVGGMGEDNASQYRQFLTQSNVDSLLVEFRQEGRLRMVSVVDCMSDGLSAVYTFYDGDEAAASYGTYSVLWLADWCRRIGKPYLYLGYWIAGSRKMAYKINFQPLEGLCDGVWQPLEKNNPAEFQ